jgi:hypothetical protein
MNLIELNRYLRQLRLGGIAAVLETRLQQAQAEPMAPIDFLSCLVCDELTRRGDRLLERRRKQHSNTSPSGGESPFAHMALDASAARGAPKVSNPIAPTEENLMAGMKLFKNDCAGCHGTPNTATENEASTPTPLNSCSTLRANRNISSSGS